MGAGGRRQAYTWWRVILVALSGGAYVAIFSIPLAYERFMLDPSNVALTATALAIGAFGAAIVEALWWLRERPARRGLGCGAGRRADGGRRTSGKRGLALRLRAKPKPAAGDRNRLNA